MVLHFTDGKNNLNINFSAEIFNTAEYRGESFVTKISADDLQRIRAEMDFNCYNYAENIYQAPGTEPLPF